MQKKQDLDQLSKHQRLRTLIKKRERLAYTLSVITLIISGIYVLMMGYAAELLTLRPWSDSMITSGIIYTIFIIVASVVFSGFYTWWANKYFDHESKNMIDNIQVNSND